MTVTEIKTRLHQVIDRLPENENQLGDVLLLLTKIEQGKNIDDVTFDSYVDDIIAENKELLERLAK
ncbi:hypothetical protein ACFQZI_04750 [Mucilaginibacter lutimaris]|uniref:Uncharacterized protein n=1 Tax=Mucilaginibacter lutimaris TaxID=931629 RepID=A0ABW2ZD74_9SPHI